MNIDAIMILPDTEQIEFQREKNMTSDNSIKLTVSFEVHTYYPSLRKDKVGSSESSVTPGYNTDYAIVPKRTRWFNNILKSRESSSGSSNNTNSSNV